VGHQSVAAPQQFPHFGPVDFARVQPEGYPTLRCEVRGEIKSARLGISQRLVIAGQYLAGYRHDAITVMVVEEVGEGLFPHQKLRV